MEIPLPSGASITVKDNTPPGDRFAVRSAIRVVVEDGKSVIEGSEPAQWKAFLARVITAWSFPAPIPAVAGQQVLDEYPDTDDDIDALDEALQERFDRVTKSRRSPNSRKPPSPTSGTSAG